MQNFACTVMSLYTPVQKLEEVWKSLEKSREVAYAFVYFINENSLSLLLTGLCPTSGGEVILLNSEKALDWYITSRNVNSEFRGILLLAT